MVSKITSFDVARRAGVSQPTVSRALRNLPGASPETIAKVRQAAQDLAYVPSESGRALVLQRTGRVAVVSAELTNPYYPELVEPLRERLAARDLRTVLVTDSENSAVTVEALSDGSYDGVILTTTLRNSALPRDLTERGIPHVLVNRVLDRPESSSCAIDNAAGALLIAALLADLGHQRIGSIQGPITTSTGRERGETLRRSLKGLGVPLRRELVRRVPFGHDAGQRAAREVLRMTPRPTAVVCGNDVIALGVLSAAQELGVDVPAELTVIGFDDIPMAAWPLVNLTTVHCDLPELAAVAVDLLDAEMKGTRSSDVVRIRPELRLRGTHAAH